MTANEFSRARTGAPVRTHYLNPLISVEIGFRIEHPPRNGNQAMERRLAAILVADVVGYSRLMEADEAGTAECT